jgi:hypothetical protein
MAEVSQRGLELLYTPTADPLLSLLEVPNTGGGQGTGSASDIRVVGIPLKSRAACCVVWPFLVLTKTSIILQS